MGNNKVINETYLNIRHNLKTLSDTFKRIYATERQKTFSNSLIFLKRSVDKLLLAEKYINNINLDKDFDKESDAINKKDINDCIKLHRDILGKVDTFKQQIQKMLVVKQASSASQDKQLLQNNMDQLNLAMKSLRYLDLNIQLAAEDIKEDVVKKTNKNSTLRVKREEEYE